MVAKGASSYLKTSRKGFVAACQAFNHLLWPKRCLICDEPIAENQYRMCQVCWQGLQSTLGRDYCHQCGRDVTPYGIVDGRCAGCQEQEFDYDAMIRVGVYESVLRSLLLSLKFRDRTDLADWLGDMMVSAVTVSGYAEEIDMVVPVPLHWRRRLERGFNQAKLLTKQLRKEGYDVSTHLVRIRNTERQWSLTTHQRKKNVAGAFAVRKDHPYTGKTVCLVDDITTSGATIHECARVLKDAGARRVIVLIGATAIADNQ